MNYLFLFIINYFSHVSLIYSISIYRSTIYNSIIHVYMKYKYRFCNGAQFKIKSHKKLIFVFIWLIELLLTDEASWFWASFCYKIADYGTLGLGSRSNLELGCFREATASHSLPIIWAIKHQPLTGDLELFWSECRVSLLQAKSWKISSNFQNATAQKAYHALLHKSIANVLNLIGTNLYD